MPSIQIVSPTPDQQLTLLRDPMSMQVRLPCVKLRISDTEPQLMGDALVVRTTQNPPASITRPLTATGTAGDYQLTDVLVVGAPSPGGGYESFKVCAWAKIAGNIVTAATVAVQLKVI